MTKSATDSTPSSVVKASPTKRFFVSMLTRDIELHDSVLDLLDNCIDGILRSKGYNLKANKPYTNYWAKINFSGNEFSISDNCGGISRELAENRAFMMGKPTLKPGEKDTDSELPTVGMYGIGMKRAIFKMGRYCEVRSQTAKDSFRVEIPEAWFGDEHNWDLKLEPIRNSVGREGTEIKVSRLDLNISKRFGPGGDFEDDFRTMVSQHYGVIIQKGFRVYVNGKEIKPVPLVLRTVDLGKQYKTGIAPYLFVGLVDGVDVDLKVGFYRPALDEEELDEEATTTYSTDQAGWTIVCNDRVVVYNDKTRVTGWGEADVPSYHNQFISIAGVVNFRSTDPLKLPVTTTKRGVDGNSELYLKVKDRMRDGLRRFTSYTNRLKKDPPMRDRLFQESRAVNLDLIGEMSKKVKWKVDPKYPNAKIFAPNLPAVEKNDRIKVVRFQKPTAEIEKLSQYLFEGQQVKPSEVGARCFERVLNETNK